MGTSTIQPHSTTIEIQDFVEEFFIRELLLEMIVESTYLYRIFSYAKTKIYLTSRSGDEASEAQANGILLLMIDMFPTIEIFKAWHTSTV